MRHRSLLLTTLALCACSGAPRTGTTAQAAPASAGTTSSVAHPDWSRRAVMYEVNVRQYTPEGTLAAFRTYLPRLKALGVDILWFMPAQPIGRKNRKGSLGSYYSISDYRAINPEYGTAADFRAVVDDAHRQGLKVVLDWVPNHTAFDHPWITAHPDWYVHDATGKIINARDGQNHDTDWTDVAELNYDNRDMRRAMIADMRWWVDSMRIDGLRCDVAGGVPLDFWTEARAVLLRARPDLFLLAEDEAPALHASFDMTYGWELYDALDGVAQGKQPTSALDAYFAKQARTYPADAYRLYFTTNHDKNSWEGSELERMGPNHLPAFVLAATVQNGMPLLYTGQEVSLRKRLRFFDKDTVDWAGPSLASFYRALFDLRHAQAALANGSAGGPQSTLHTNGGDRVYAFTRTRGASTVLVAVNFADAPATVTYDALPQPGDYTDWFGKQRLSLGAAGTLPIAAHGYRVLVR